MCSLAAMWTTGRKKAPSQQDFDAWDARRKPIAPAARHALHQQDAQRLPKLTSAAKLHAALQQQDEWSGVNWSVRRGMSQDIDDERIASALRDTDGHASLALERLGFSIWS